MLEHGMSEYKRIANKARGRDKPRPTDPSERRELFEEYCAVFREPYPDSLEIVERFIPAPGREIPIRLYRHKDASPDVPQPTLLYLHGGGYMLGSLDTHATVAANMAVGTGAQVVLVHYRRVPENPYPAGLEDCYFMLEWLHENARRYNIDPDRIAVLGDSCGGGLTAAVSLKARDQKGPKIALQVLLYPGPMNTDYQTDSYIRINHDPQFRGKDLEFIMDSYLIGASRTDPYAVPLQATNFGNLPPAFIHVPELDPLYDEGILYGRKLTEAGVKATVRVARNLEHSFLRAVTVSPEAREEARVLYEAIRDGLGIGRR
ncbi:alpha/beta hydrolase [Mesorhizobium sp. 8]|uniref:alpha/beta hydrolase n=1 Tax=Mesorhizobium sp. 8 TaxID=2584466 RepID=UPI00111E18A4|nr:alpha/beta hydrolase [Mesorhizobium sp. 8]QDB99475.1 alpha/beta hydrolase [Mesorhizobium sp. 8]